MAGLKIEELRKPGDGGMYYSVVEICVDKDGNLVEAGSPQSAWMLVGAGSCIPARIAAQYGLISNEADTPTVAPPAVDVPVEEPAEKAREPEEDKQRSVRGRK